MLTLRVPPCRRAAKLILPLLLAVVIVMSVSSPAFAQPQTGGEAHLVLPDLSQANFLGGTNGRTLLMWGLAVCALGLLFGFITYKQLFYFYSFVPKLETRASNRKTLSQSDNKF